MCLEFPSSLKVEEATLISGVVELALSPKNLWKTRENFLGKRGSYSREKGRVGVKRNGKRSCRWLLRGTLLWNPWRITVISLPWRTLRATIPHERTFAHPVSDAKLKCIHSKKLPEWILSSSSSSHTSVWAAVSQWGEPRTQCSKISWKRRVGRTCTAHSQSILPYVVARTGVGDLWGFGRHQLRKLDKNQRKAIPGAVSTQNDPLGIWWI